MLCGRRADGDADPPIASAARTQLPAGSITGSVEAESLCVTERSDQLCSAAIRLSFDPAFDWLTYSENGDKTQFFGGTSQVDRGPLVYANRSASKP
jgi:hypothetical protein